MPRKTKPEKTKRTPKIEQDTSAVFEAQRRAEQDEELEGLRQRLKQVKDADHRAAIEIRIAQIKTQQRSSERIQRWGRIQHNYIGLFGQPAPKEAMVDKLDAPPVGEPRKKTERQQRDLGEPFPRSEFRRCLYDAVIEKSHKPSADEVAIRLNKNNSEAVRDQLKRWGTGSATNALTGPHGSTFRSMISQAIKAAKERGHFS
jgi:hypothetical protein